MRRLRSLARRAGLDIVGDKGDHFGPVELASNVLDGLANARVTGEAMVVRRSKDVESNIFVVRDIYATFEKEEFAIVGQGPFVVGRRGRFPVEESSKVRMSFGVGEESLLDRREECGGVEEDGANDLTRLEHLLIVLWIS